MIHVSLPPGAPTWVVGLSLAGAVLIGLSYCLVRLVRAALPDAPAERLDWWKAFWRYRRDLRRDRWRRRELRRIQRQSNRHPEQAKQVQVAANGISRKPAARGSPRRPLPPRRTASKLAQATPGPIQAQQNTEDVPHGPVS